MHIEYTLYNNNNNDMDNYVKSRISFSGQIIVNMTKRLSYEYGNAKKFISNKSRNGTGIVSIDSEQRGVRTAELRKK